MLAPSCQVAVLKVVSLPSPVTELPAAGLAGTIPPPDAYVGSTTEDAITDAARAEVEAAIAGLGVEAEPRVEYGDPAGVICEIAAAENFDLVVVGSHGSGVLKRALVGSVSHYVLHHAPCPVLVVRHPGGRSTDNGD